METRVRIFLLIVVLATLPGCATVRHWFHRDQATVVIPDEPPPPRVIEPEVARRKITVPKIRNRNIELGLDYGVLSIEDFGTNPSYGVTAAYHITEDFFFQGEWGRSRAGRTSFEELNGGVQLIPDS